MVSESGARLEHADPHPEMPSRAPTEARHVPATATPALAGLRGPASSVAGLPIAHLQRAAGNAAVAKLLAREARAHAPAKESAALPTIQREPQGPSEAKVNEGLPDGYEAMNEGEKVNAIRGLLGSASASVISRAWSRLSAPLETARANPDLFAASVKRSAAVADLPPFAALKEEFEAAVLGRARGYLDSNKEAVQAERARTGVPTTGENAGETATADQKVQEIQQLAPEMERAKKARAELLRIQLGTEKRGKGDTQDLYPIIFQPGSPPDARDARTMYDAVLEKWNAGVAVELALIKKCPSAAFFMGEGGDPSKISAGTDIKVARAEITKGLDDLEKKILAAIPKIGNGVNFTDLIPIHQELLVGPVWSKPVESAVARDAISGANVGEVLKTLGLSTLSAAAFLFGSFASGGLATFLFAAGAAVSGAQAGMSWDKYFDLAAAHKGSIDPAAQLVSGEQVDAAMISAALDTIFAAIDVWQGASGLKKAAVAAGTAKQVRRAGEAVGEGAKAGATAGTAAILRNLSGAEKPAEALAKAVAEVGPEQAQKISGLSFERLAEIAGGAGTALGDQFLMLAEKGVGAMSEETKDLIAKIPKLAEISDAAEAEKVLAAGASQFGYKGLLEKVGGWKAIRDMAVMKSGSGTAAALEGWRAGIVRELDKYIQEVSDELSKAVRTGTEAAASDVDVQIVGGTAAELQKRAEGWLGSRLGTDVEGGKRLLDAQIFIDPSRAHLVDIMKNLDETVRAEIRSEMAKVEPPLIFGARLTAADKLGQEAVDRVMKEARQVGLEDVKRFVPLTPDEQAKAATTIDVLMKRLPDMAPGERGATVKEISMTQARIDASHADAYVGGGVAVWVTGRDMDVAKMAEALNVGVEDLAKWTAAQRISAALSEGKWLDAAVSQLRSPGAGDDITALAHAVRDIGKHGARAAEVLKVGGRTNVARLDQIMEALVSYKSVTPVELKEIVTSGDLVVLRGELDRLLGALSSETGNAVTALRGEAQSFGVSLAGNPDFEALEKWRGTYAKLASGARSASEAQVRALETALQQAQEATVQPPTEPPAVYPVATPQSVPPAAAPTAS